MSKKIALLSVYNKNGVVDFARELVALGFTLISSGGTAKVIKDAGIEVGDVADITGRKAVLRHRVVTLSPEIHGGLLAMNEDEDELRELGWPNIDLVYIDLYPLEQEVQNSQATPNSVREKTDIGGPALLRSAAKGQRIVISDLADTTKVIEWYKNGMQHEEQFRQQLAAKAEYKAAEYALLSAKYHSNNQTHGVLGKKVYECRYGENPSQKPAALFSTTTEDVLSLEKWKIITGEPSFNNITELDRLLQTITHIGASFKKGIDKITMAVAAKHGNPCGCSVAVQDERGDNHYGRVLKKMLMGDPRAIFGGSVMVNFPVDKSSAEIMLYYEMGSGRRILDEIIAPEFSEEAIAMLRRKGDKCCLIVNPSLQEVCGKEYLDRATRVRYVRGGYLLQPNYVYVPDWASLKVQRKYEHDAKLAWAIGTTSNSNTVTITKDGCLIGNGVGQQDRVSCCELAIKRAHDAGHNTNESVAYSDGFFPFEDGPQKLIDAGVKVIVSSGGSIRDEKIISLCQKNNVEIHLLSERGFFGH